MLPQFPVIRSLMLVLTTRCPLACPYCSQGGVIPKRDMPPEVLAKALELAARTADKATPLTIQLTGGEPALVPALVEAALLGAQNIVRPLSFALQSSGVGLDRTMLALCKAHQVQVGISLDGPPAVQESIRGQAAATLHGLALLEAEQVPFRVTTVLSAANVTSLDRLVFFLAQFGMARGLGLDILVRRGRAAQSAGQVEDARLVPPNGDALAQGLAAMLNALEMVNRRRRIPLRFRELDLTRRCLSRPLQPEASVRPFCLAAAGESLAVAPDGQLYPCTQVLGDERFRAGTVEVPHRPPLFPAIMPDRDWADCPDCPLEGRCPGDCPSRLTHNPGERRLACVLYQTLACHRHDKGEA